MTRKFSLFVDGKWVEGTGGDPTRVINPATEQEIGSVDLASEKDVEGAVEAARRAFDLGPWPRMSVKERATYMLKMGEIMLRRRDELIALAVEETGCPTMIATQLHVDTPIGFFIDLADRILPSYPFSTAMMPVPGPIGLAQGVVVREPVGVAALITPFNFPLFLNLAKVGPALAAGCTMVLKPSPYTPLSAGVLAEIAEEADLPPGVFNMVNGEVATGTYLTRSPMVDMVSFTGSDLVGGKILAQAAESIKKVVLELGGKSANVVFADAPLERVVPDIIMNMTLQCGQGCALLTRTLVQREIYQDLLAVLTDALKFVQVGNPAEPNVTMGPLIREEQRRRVEGYIAAGREQGAQVAFGGGRPENLMAGYFVEPTLFSNVTNSMKIAREEIFGPVGALIPFDDEDDAVRLANDSPYGLGGGVWSADGPRAFAVAQQIRTGTVIVNGGGFLSPYAPFGGYKRSGMGREFGEFGLSEFLETKSIVMGVGSA